MEMQDFSRLTIDEQHARKAEIVDAFRVFWSKHPSEEEFAAATGGVILFPEILYILVTPPLVV